MYTTEEALATAATIMMTTPMTSSTPFRVTSVHLLIEQSSKRRRPVVPRGRDANRNHSGRRARKFSIGGCVDSYCASNQVASTASVFALLGSNKLGDW